MGDGDDDDDGEWLGSGSRRRLADRIAKRLRKPVG